MNESWKQVTQGFPWTSFGNGHYVSTLKSNRPGLCLNWSWRREPSILYLEKAKSSNPCERGTGFKISGCVFFFELLANGRRSTIPHMQAANACGCKLEQEEASSSVRTEWQTKSSPTAVLATNLGDSESPSQKLVHHKRALQIKCKPPTKRAHSVRH